MKKFTNISPRAFEHPADRAALSALRKIRGFDLVLKKVMGLIGERRLRLIFLASALRIDSEQKPEMHKIFLEVCEQFDLSETPELYLTYSAEMNASAIGVDHPFVVLNSGLVERLSNEELQYVMAHEVGHILSGHSLYRTLLLLILHLSNQLLGIPKLLFMPILVGLYEWSRKSELTADRAGLLSVQDLNVAQAVILKLCGASDLNSFNVKAFEKQAEEYEESKDLIDNVFKFLNLIFRTHPFPVLRLREIRRFFESAEYKSAIAGEYPKRSPEDLKHLAEDLASAKESYSDSISKTKDTVVESIANFWDDVETRGAEAWDAIFKPKKKTGN